MTRSGATMRAFGVNRSAWQRSFAATSFETIRCRRSSASGPDTRRYARGRNATLGIRTSVGRDVALPWQGRAEADRQGSRSGAPAARAVPDGEVAGAPRRDRSANGPRDVGLQGLRRGRGAGHAGLRGTEVAPAER